MFKRTMLFNFGKKVVYTYGTEQKKRRFVVILLPLLHVFSCRLYGLRKYKNQINEDEEIAKELQNGNKSNVGTNTKDK